MKNAIINNGNYSSSKFGSNQASLLTILKFFRSNNFFFKPKFATVVVNSFLLMFLFLGLYCGETKAATFTVNLTTDAADANTADNVCDANLAVAGLQCTLRAAIEQANVAAGVDDINFSLGGANTINLTIGELSINNSLNINGTGARQLIMQRAVGAATNFRVFFVQTGIAATVNISGITIANGYLNNDSGAGISNSGATLNLIEVAVKNNVASGGSGGGIFNGSSGKLNLIRSTVNNNTALQGGGINNNSSTATANIINSTISNNAADDNGTPALALGAGILNFAALTIVNSTVSNNTSTEQGGGIYLSSTHNTSVRNTIVAANAAPFRPDVYGTATSQGNNLIGISENNSGFTNGANGDKTGTAAEPLPALLGALQNNGGQTDTRAVLPGSPAMNGGNSCVVEAPLCVNSALTTDSRGLPRKMGYTVDIGAYEEQLVPTAANVSVAGKVLQPDGRGLSRAVVALTCPNGDVRFTVSNAFGHFRFDDIAVGETYILEVRSKRFVFPQQVVYVTGERGDFDFVSTAAVGSAEISPR